jgi:tetratricopeptide (TPR) repeat protein
MRAAALALLLCGAPARAALFGGSVEGPRRHFEAGRYDEVVRELGDAAALQRLRRRAQRQGYFYLGLAYERLGRVDKALGVFQLGVKLHPRDINLLSQLGRLLHGLGLEEQADPIFRRVLVIHPNNAAAHLGLGEIDHALGFLDRSLEHYDRALETMGGEPTVWRSYAEVLLSARDHKTAELAASRSLQLRDDARAAFALAAAQRGQDRLDEALGTLTAALERFPDRDDLALARATWLLEARRYDEALAASERLVAAAEPPPLAYWIRARVRLKRDQYRAAVHDLRSAAALERRSPFVAAASRELLRQLGAEAD